MDKPYQRNEFIKYTSLALSRNTIVDHSKIVGSSFRCNVGNLYSWVLVLAVRFQFSKALLLLY